MTVISPDSAMTVSVVDTFTLSRGGFLFWTDTARHSIMRANLDGTNTATLLVDNQNLIQPGTFSQHQKCSCSFSCDNYHTEGIAVDWINNKLYWTDVETRWIGVLDLTTRYYGMLLTTQSDVRPREIVADPTTRYCVYIIFVMLLIARYHDDVIEICG